MKKILCLLLAISFYAPILFAQQLEASKTHEISKDARKGELVSFEYDQDAREYWLTFKREKGRKKIFEIYHFDYEFNLIENETLEEKDAKVKKKWFRDSGEPEDSDPWHNPKVVRLGSNPMQITLRLGTLTREWVTRSMQRGNYIYYVSSYEYEFNEEKKVKPKIDPRIEYPEGTPKMVRNMVTNMASKVRPLEFMSDEPKVNIQLGNNKAMSPLSVISAGFRKHDYTEASGDLVVAGLQEYPMDDQWYSRAVLLKYSAKDLSLLHQEVVSFDFPMFEAYSKVLDDGTMTLIFMPYKAQKGEPDPNPQRFFYLRVSPDATVAEKAYFESPCRQWNIADAMLDEDGGLYFYGLASTKHNGKYKMTDGAPLGKAEGMQIAKFKNGKLDYLTFAGVEDMAAKLVKPSNQKKADEYDGKDMTIEPGFITPEGELLICGRMPKNSAVNFFHFAPDGKFKAQYSVQPEQKIKEGAIDYGFFLNADNKTATIFIGELEGEKKGRQLKYPRLGTLDLASTSISDMKNFGYSKKEKYYLDDVYPFTAIDKEHLVFFSRDDKDQEIWLGRVGLGK